MIAELKIKALPIPFIYFVAGCAAFHAAILSSFAAMAYYGFPEAGSELLTAAKFVAFASVAVGGFCFPALSRWFRSAVLLGFGLALYCVADSFRMTNDYFLQMFPYPVFWSIVWGGCTAVGLHCVIELFQFLSSSLRNAGTRSRSVC